MLRALIDFFANLGGRPPADQTRVSLAAATAFHAAFNDDPLPEKAKRAATEEGLLREYVFDATFHRGARRYLSFETESPFDIDWLEMLKNSVVENGIPFEIEADGDWASTSITACIAKCDGRTARISAEPQLDSRQQHERFLNAVASMLPRRLEFRPIFSDAEGDNLFTYALLPPEKWAELETTAPKLMELLSVGKLTTATSAPLTYV